MQNAVITWPIEEKRSEEKKSEGGKRIEMRCDEIIFKPAAHSRAGGLTNTRARKRAKWLHPPLVSFRSRLASLTHCVLVHDRQPSRITQHINTPERMRYTQNDAQQQHLLGHVWFL